jgi:hypothetical protein
VEIRPAGSAGVPATVERISPGPGRWEIALTAPMPLRAHLPLGVSPPRAGERVAVVLDPRLATVVARPRQASCVRVAPASPACSPS